VKFARSLKFFPQSNGFAHREKLCEEHRRTFVPRVDSFLVLIEPLFHLPREGEGKQAEPDASWCNVFNDDSVVQLKEVLEMSTCVLARQTTKLVCLHHHDEASPELKVSSPSVDNGPNEHVGNSGGGIVTK
jgi:hypothetical protein